MGSASRQHAGLAVLRTRPLSAFSRHSAPQGKEQGRPSRDAPAWALLEPGAVTAAPTCGWAGTLGSPQGGWPCHRPAGAVVSLCGGGQRENSVRV